MESCLGLDVELYSFLTRALDGGDGWSLRPNAFTTLLIKEKLCGSQSRTGRFEKKIVSALQIDWFFDHQDVVKPLPSGLSRNI